MMPGIKNFFEKIIGKEAAEEQDKTVTAEEKKQIEEGEGVISELEGKMDLEKKAQKLQETDKDLRADFSKPERRNN